MRRDLFQTSRATIDQLNTTLTDSVPLDIPAIEAESCIFRIEREQNLALDFAVVKRRGKKKSGESTDQEAGSRQRAHSAFDTDSVSRGARAVQD